MIKKRLPNLLCGFVCIAGLLSACGKESKINAISANEGKATSNDILHVGDYKILNAFCVKDNAESNESAAGSMPVISEYYKPVPMNSQVNGVFHVLSVNGLFLSGKLISTSHNMLLNSVEKYSYKNKKDTITIKSSTNNFCSVLGHPKLILKIKLQK